MAVSKKNIKKMCKALEFDPETASKIIAEELKKKGFIPSGTISRAPKIPKPIRPIVYPGEEIKPKPIIMPIRNRRRRATTGPKKPGKGGSATGIKVSEEGKLIIVGKH